MGFQYYEKNLDPQQLVSSEEESAKRFVNSERQTVNRLFACSTTIRRLSFSLYFFSLCATCPERVERCAMLYALLSHLTSRFQDLSSNSISLNERNCAGDLNIWNHLRTSWLLPDCERNLSGLIWRCFSLLP